MHHPFHLVNPSDVEHLEILDEFPSTNCGEKFPVEMMAKIPDNVTLTLIVVKFPEKTLVILMGEITH